MNPTSHSKPDFDAPGPSIPSWTPSVKTFACDGQQFCIRPMNSFESSQVSSLFQTYFPSLIHSSIHFFSEEEFFAQKVVHLDHWTTHEHERHYFTGVIEHVDSKQLIMAFVFGRDRYDNVIRNMASVIDPQYRGLNLSKVYGAYVDELSQKSGCDLVYGFVSTQHTMAQKLVLLAGGKFGGFCPGLVRRKLGDGTAYRDTDVSVYKFYGDVEEKVTPVEQCQFDPQGLQNIQ